MASTYLHKNQGTATNAKKFTVSCWFKRSKLGTEQRLFQGYKDSNDRLYAKFETDDQLMIFAAEGGTDRVNWTTNKVFRDTNAWYHLVLVGDSTESTEADRIKLYINGVNVDNLGGYTKTTTNITQNMDWGIQLAQTNNTFTISGTESHTQLFDGYISYFHYVDGTAYQASTFGSIDSTTGEWQINTAPTITMGNNGFTILKDGNTVTDQSSNSNDWAVGAGTLTKSEDCPSNVFATINQLQIESGGSPALTFSNGNTKVTRSGNWRGHMSTLGVNKGKWYWEVKQTGNVALGIGKFGGDVDSWNYLAGGQSWLGDRNDVWISYNNANTQVKYTGSSSGGNWHPVYNDGEIISIAFDADNGTIWQGINGTWMNSATETEIENGTTTNAMYSGITIGVDHFGAIGSVENGNLEYNFGNGYFGTTAVSSAGTNASGLGIFEYDVPAGYTALCTKGLNL
tara:strand:+ start:2033 stop:3400 length:1368 start_codon:yes stop_codon:yes gene_type:complete